jgi:hypothetical protein
LRNPGLRGFDHPVFRYATYRLLNLLHIKHRAADRDDFDLGVNVAIFTMDFPDGIIDFYFTLAVFYRFV